MQRPAAGTPENREAGGSTGLATLRRDGFASLDAGDEEGTITTRPVMFTGKHLFVNVDAPRGELRVEILDERATDRAVHQGRMRPALGRLDEASGRLEGDGRLCAAPKSRCGFASRLNAANSTRFGSAPIRPGRAAASSPPEVQVTRITATAEMTLLRSERCRDLDWRYFSAMGVTPKFRYPHPSPLENIMHHVTMHALRSLFNFIAAAALIFGLVSNLRAKTVRSLQPKS